MLAAELVRIPHRIESSGLRLRKPAVADKACQLCWPTLQRLLTVDEASDGLQKVSLHVPDFSRVLIAALPLENGLLSTRESAPTSAMARHHPTSDRTRGFAHGT